MDKVIQTICLHFNIDKEIIINKTNKQDISIVRNYVYYILHYDFKYSIGQIAKKFNRCKREISYRVSETKYRVEYFTQNKKEYKEVIEALKKATLI